MRSTIYILAVFALFLACRGEKQKNNASNTLTSMEQESELIEGKTATPAVNIKDIFLLLPEDVFPMEAISVSNRKLLLKNIGTEIAYEISPTPIEICDVRNGFLSLAGMQYGWEMCYWNLKDGRKLVAINDLTESGSKIRIFFHQNGKLTEDTNYRLGGNQTFQLTDFVDVSKLETDIRKVAEKQFANGDYIIFYHLPQKGTSLTLNLDTEHLMEYNNDLYIKDGVTKEVIIKWENEKWKR